MPYALETGFLEMYGPPAAHSFGFQAAGSRLVLHAGAPCRSRSAGCQFGHQGSCRLHALHCQSLTPRTYANCKLCCWRTWPLSAQVNPATLCLCGGQDRKLCPWPRALQSTRHPWGACSSGYSACHITCSSECMRSSALGLKRLKRNSPEVATGDLGCPLAIRMTRKLASGKKGDAVR